MVLCGVGRMGSSVPLPPFSLRFCMHPTKIHHVLSAIWMVLHHFEVLRAREGITFFFKEALKDFLKLCFISLGNSYCDSSENSVF